MKKNNITIFAGLLAASLMSSNSMAAATFVIDVQDGPDEGFNDPAPRTPIGGNTGTTLGEQRMQVFQRAGEIWGGFINSDVPIVISSQFDPQFCQQNSVTLGSAGSLQVFRNFPNRPFANTWYGGALANSLRGSDGSPGTADINATFNSELDNGCFGNGSGWYYGLDGATPAGFTSLLPVVLHELGHGLGSQTFTNGQTGTFNGGFKDAWSHFMTDLSAESTWGDLPSNADRAASGINNGFLVWDGPSVNTAYRQILNSAGNVVELKINFPTTSNHVAGTAEFGMAIPTGGFSGNIMLAIDDESDEPGDVNDGCSPITNNLSGHIAIINRGICPFVEKVAAAQAAGAIGVLIANNVNIGISGMSGDDPTITIPSLFISKAVGENIQSDLLGGGVSVTMGFTTEAHQGANNGHVRLFAPTTFQGGSSVSHWDTAATPSLLMEPQITPSLFDQIDLTFHMFKDIGWDVVIDDPIYSNGFETP